MHVRELMTEDPVTVAGGARVVDAIVLLFTRGFCHLPVLNDEGELLGMVTDRDLREFSHHMQLADDRADAVKLVTQPVGDLVRRKPVVVYADDTVHTAVATLVREKLSGLPVIERGSGELVGILTSQDVLQHVVDAGLL